VALAVGLGHQPDCGRARPELFPLRGPLGARARGVASAGCSRGKHAGLAHAGSCGSCVVAYFRRSEEAAPRPEDGPGLAGAGGRRRLVGHSGGFQLAAAGPREFDSRYEGSRSGGCVSAPARSCIAASGSGAACCGATCCPEDGARAFAGRTAGRAARSCNPVLSA
jgi:hypothetical protein